MKGFEKTDYELVGGSIYTTITNTAKTLTFLDSVDVIEIQRAQAVDGHIAVRWDGTAATAPSANDTPTTDYVFNTNLADDQVITPIDPVSSISIVFATAGPLAVVVTGYRRKARA